MPRFRKKPVVIDAILWDGDNYDEVMVFTKGNAGNITDLRGDTIVVKTLEGDMKAPKGNWILKGVAGEFYPCDPEIFDRTYVQVPEKCPSCGQHPPEELHPDFLCETCITHP
jgi:hypothetical protein